MPPTKSAALAGSGLALGLAAVAAYAGLSAQSQIFGQTIVAPPSPNEIALTFDDGPNPAATPQLLEVLARHSVRATFFLIGNFVRREAHLVRQIAAAGHAVGNHTMTHRRLLLLGSRTIHQELADCNQAIEDTLGNAVQLFRPPYGSRRPVVMQLANELGLTTVQWNVMVGDWNPVSAATLLVRLERGMRRNQARGRGSNIVLHDGGHSGLGQPRLATVAAVDRLLSRLPPETAFVTPGAWS